MVVGDDNLGAVHVIEHVAKIARGRPMLTVLCGLAEFERELIRAREGSGGTRAEKLTLCVSTRR